MYTYNFILCAPIPFNWNTRLHYAVSLVLFCIVTIILLLLLWNGIWSVLYWQLLQHRTNDIGKHSTLCWVTLCHRVKCVCAFFSAWNDSNIPSEIEMVLPLESSFARTTYLNFCVDASPMSVSVGECVGRNKYEKNALFALHLIIIQIHSRSTPRLNACIVFISLTSYFDVTHCQRFRCCCCCYYGCCHVGGKFQYEHETSMRHTRANTSRLSNHAYEKTTTNSLIIFVKHGL